MVVTLTSHATWQSPSPLSSHLTNSFKNVGAKLRKKIEQTHLLDKQRQVFGAQSHDYRLYPTLTTEELSLFAYWLGAQFPADLQAFYREVGNGVAGPHYGSA